MITLGVDPGIAILGYGVIVGEDEPTVVDVGVVETTPAELMPDRLLRLYEGLTAVIEASRPDVMAIEQLFFARNVTNALSVGQARGVALLTAARFGIPVAEYKPSEVKLAVAGHGNADKQQMQTMVQLILGLESLPRPDDAADALAIAICHVYSSRLDRIASKQ